MWDIEKSIESGYISVQFTRSYLRLLPKIETLHPRVSKMIGNYQEYVETIQGLKFKVHESFEHLPVGKMVYFQETGVISPLIILINKKRKSFEIFNLVKNGGKLSLDYFKTVEKNAFTSTYSFDDFGILSISDIVRFPVGIDFMPDLTQNVKSKVLQIDPVSTNYSSLLTNILEICRNAQIDRNTADKKMQAGISFLKSLLCGIKPSSKKVLSML